METLMALWNVQRAFIEAMYEPYFVACDTMIDQWLRTPGLFKPINP